VSWAPRARTWKLLGQSQPGLPIPLPPTGAPAECHPRLGGLTRTARSLDPGASVPGAIRTRTAHLLRWCLLPLGYEDMEPPPGADPGHPPYEGGAAAVRGGVAGHPGFEPGKLRVQSPAGLPIPPMAIECGRRESNAQAARFELARYPGSRHSRMVRRQGLEPRPFGLRVRCSDH
jgi:hypothetical protein